MPLLTALENIGENSAVTIGNFDGFHLGHQKIIEVLCNRARQQRLRSVLMTFSPHPQAFFGQEIRRIQTDRQRKEWLAGLGLDLSFFIDFGQLAVMEPVDFIGGVLVGRLRMKILVVSRDFRFGRKRQGDLGFLKRESARFGFEVVEVEPQMVGGERVSSTLIRLKLEAGDVVAARRMLGRDYRIDGVVRRGFGRGRSLGYPTLNVETENQILPPGVFHTRTEIDGLFFESVTHIGTCPTFAGKDQTVETHLIGFDRMIYGQEVRICFRRKIRDEKKFDSSVDLSRQIALDIESITFDK
jgi:riboflavin kinase / FMN adenylyltransferase